MTRDDARLRRKLQEEREQLLEDISHREQRTRWRRNIGVGNHMADDATEAFDQTAALTLDRSQDRVLREIEYALSKFEKGTYGLCERCGQEIDFARLKALPYARYCLRCQKYEELPGSDRKRSDIATIRFH